MPPATQLGQGCTRSYRINIDIQLDNGPFFGLGCLGKHRFKISSLANFKAGHPIGLRDSRKIRIIQACPGNTVWIIAFLMHTNSPV